MSGIATTSMSRRRFLGAASADAALAACGFAQTALAAEKASAEKETGSSSASSAYTDSADIVVCGGGGAGLNAAYRALELGASVIVLEKSGFTGGTLQYAEGAFQAAGTPDELELDDGTNPATPGDSTDLMCQNWLAMADGDCDEELIRTIVGKSAEALEWIKTSFNLGVSRTAGNRPVPFVPQETVADRIHYLVDLDDVEATDGHGGKPWMDNAAKAVTDAGGKIVFGAEVVEFLTDDDGRVCGVLTLDGGKYEATAGVICATGGIDHNEVLAKHVNPYHYWQMTHDNITSVEANTGEGILAGMALGAQCSFHGTDNNPANFWIGTNKHMMNLIAVGPRGYRFAREDTTYGFWSRCLYYQVRQEGGQDGDVWIVFGPDLFDDNPALQDADQVDAWQKDGTLVTGADVAELAEKTGLPQAALQQTMDEWAECCKAGEDPRFGRDSAFDGIEAPYWAMKLIMGSTGAFGGMVINTNAQVVDYTGTPIEGLYAAGNCSAGWLGDFYYGSGTCLMACAALGMIAAESIINGAPEATDADDSRGRSDAAGETDDAADAATADLSGVADGTYQGEAKGMESTITVSVTVKDGKIVDMTAEGEETQGIGSKALEQLPGDIVAAGTAEGVDGVAGATVTSKAIFDAVAEALKA